MLYYFGKGKKLKKEDCKEYKTKDGAEKAWEKAVKAGDADVSVWDENGVLVLGMTDDVPEGALQTNPDGSVNVFDADGNKVGTVDAETVAAVTRESSTGDADEPQRDEKNDGRGNMPSEQEKGQNEENTEQHEAATTGGDNGQQSGVSESDTEKVIIPQGAMKVTVICDGTLNLRRSPHWGNENICGRASRGQSYYVKEIHMVDGKKMVRTIDDIYLSGSSEHVQFEQL